MDVGTEYRSIILCEDEEQLQVAREAKEAHQVLTHKRSTYVYAWMTSSLLHVGGAQFIPAVVED